LKSEELDKEQRTPNSTTTLVSYWNSSASLSRSRRTNGNKPWGSVKLSLPFSSTGWLGQSQKEIGEEVPQRGGVLVGTSVNKKVRKKVQPLGRDSGGAERGNAAW